MGKLYAFARVCRLSAVDCISKSAYYGVKAMRYGLTKAMVKR